MRAIPILIETHGTIWHVLCAYGVLQTHQWVRAHLFNHVAKKNAPLIDTEVNYLRDLMFATVPQCALVVYTEPSWPPTSLQAQRWLEDRGHGRFPKWTMGGVIVGPYRLLYAGGIKRCSHYGIQKLGFVPLNKGTCATNQLGADGKSHR